MWGFMGGFIKTRSGKKEHCDKRKMLRGMVRHWDFLGKYRG